MIGGFQDPVTALSEYIASDHADDIFVVDDQDCNGLSAFHRYPTRGAQARSHLMHCPAWEICPITRTFGPASR
jgi:hypothetical protein